MILHLVMHGLWTILGALWLVGLAGAIIINGFGRRQGTRLLAPPGKEREHG